MRWKCHHDPDTVNCWHGDGILKDVRVYGNPHNPLGASVEVNVTRDVELSLYWDCNGKIFSHQEHIERHGLLSVMGVPEQTSCEIHVEVEDAAGYQEKSDIIPWVSGVLPEEIPPLNLVVNESEYVQPGITIINYTNMEEKGNLYAMGVDTTGTVVWMYLVDETEVAHDDHYVRVLEDGNLMLMLSKEAKVITPAGETLYEITNDELSGNSHDILNLPGGDVLFIVAETKTLFVEALGEAVEVAGNRLVRVNDRNEVVWTWSSFEHLDTSRFPGTLSLNTAKGTDDLDWIHANAIVSVDDGNAVLMSSRSQSWVVKIDLETGDVDWIFGKEGDFALDSGSWNYNQHAPEWEADGSLLLYDNGNERPEGPSTRVVRYALDQENRRAEEIWSWNCPQYTSRVGDANLLDNGNVLVTQGAPNNNRPSILEVTPQGDVVWQLTMEGHVYRAERIQMYTSP